MGKKQIQKEHWEGHDHQSIYNAAQAFQTGNPQAAQESINSIAEQLGDIMHTLGGKVQGILVEDWRGAAAKSLQANMSEYFRASERGIISIRHVADRMPPLADAMSAAKRSIEPPMSDAQISQLKKSGSSDADIQQRKNQEQFFARLQMVGLFSEPVVREGDNVTDVRPPQGNNPGNITLQQPANGSESGTGGGGGGGQNGGGSGGGQGSGDLSKLTDGLADKNTKPAFSDGSGNQSGQGQGAGAGSGSGAGGGSPKVVPAVRAAVWATPSAVLVAAQIRPAPVCRWVAPPRPVTARPPAQVQAPVPSAAQAHCAAARAFPASAAEREQTPPASVAPESAAAQWAWAAWAWPQWAVRTGAAATAKRTTNTRPRSS
ncbi:hypothetical protein L836_0997 [Mycobacteroides abscessus MAB_110811_2726]|nr:hypothetical protein L836_0997 [Mycobacteroides abscessus MAB_110811_2726]